MQLVQVSSSPQQPPPPLVWPETEMPASQDLRLYLKMRMHEIGGRS